MIRPIDISYTYLLTCNWKLVMGKIMKINFTKIMMSSGKIRWNFLTSFMSALKCILMVFLHNSTWIFYTKSDQNPVNCKLSKRQPNSNAMKLELAYFVWQKRWIPGLIFASCCSIIPKENQICFYLFLFW